MTNNLVSLQILKNKISKLGLDDLINEIGYAKWPKKYYVVLKNGKKVSFGDVRYEDFLIHKDKYRQFKYRQRHKNDNIDDPNYPGFWSWFILWN